MGPVLVDTDVVSFLFKGDSRAATYGPLLRGRRIAVSFMTVAELLQWAALRQWGPGRLSRLEATLRNYIIVAADFEMCRTWGTLRAQGSMAGRTIAPQDAWLAATALRHGLPLVTHNPSDYVGIVGLDIRTAGT